MNSVVRQPLLVALLSLVFFVSVIGITTEFPAVAACNPAPLGRLLNELQCLYPTLARWCSALLLLTGGVLLGRQTMNYNLYGTNCSLALPLFALFCRLLAGQSGDPLTQSCALFLLVAASSNSYRSFRNGFSFGECFRCGCYIGVLPLIYAGTLPLLLLLPLAASLFKRSFRELFVAGVGALLPFAAASYMGWACGGAIEDAAAAIGQALSRHDPAACFRCTEFQWIVRGVLACMAVCAALIFFRNIRTTGTKQRFILLFNFYLLLLTIALPFLPGSVPGCAVLAAIPLTVAVPVLFVRLHGAVAWSLYLLLLFLCSLEVL